LIKTGVATTVVESRKVERLSTIKRNLLLPYSFADFDLHHFQNEDCCLCFKKWTISQANVQTSSLHENSSPECYPSLANMIKLAKKQK
jgi:hypothetical protein